MHKITKTLIHVWISIVSIGAFCFGWALLAHSEKPEPLAISQPQTTTYSAPNLQPIPSLDDYLKNNYQPSQVFQNQSPNIPRLRTRAS